MIVAGDPKRLGATRDGDGVNFALYSGAAEAVELCLFNADGSETARHALTVDGNGVWSGYLPGCASGQRYGYRVHGPYRPGDGQRFNANKLLLDPYATRLDGDFVWAPAVFAHSGDPDEIAGFDRRDSAPFVPKCVVSGGDADAAKRGPRRPWSDTIIYELNVRGYTMRHPQLDDAQRGKFAGLAQPRVLEYLRSLGITSVELMPVHAFIDERFLSDRGLHNFWGYNSINFFAPQPRYAHGDAVNEFIQMVDAIHDAGLEVLLDVVYNHTAEGNAHGPMLSFRGIDNQAYYRLHPDVPSRYINDTGCGNTVNVDHPRVRQLIVDSLCYWVTTMGVDGFRFDLAPILGRTRFGFDASHALFAQIAAEPALRGVKLIAEPWDIGPGGYQLGHFPAPWAEWNDRYRDMLRAFWRGDERGNALARRIHGSSDLFEHKGLGPAPSINFVTSHDGFTLTDLVSYEHRHNLANGENNRDGHGHNLSQNFGHEGPSDEPKIVNARRKQRLNMLATLLISQGTPMLLAGDEFGNTQHGNNNAYAQDNEIAWLDWRGLDDDPKFHAQVKSLIALRREQPLLRQQHYLHGQREGSDGWRDIEWLTPAAIRMDGDDWPDADAFAMMLSDCDEPQPASALLVAINAGFGDTIFKLPKPPPQRRWQKRFCSAPLTVAGLAFILPANSLAVFERR